MTDTALLTGQDIGEAEGALTALLERAIAPSGRSRVDTSRCGCSLRGRRSGPPLSYTTSSPTSASSAWIARAS